MPSINQDTGIADEGVSRTENVGKGGENDLEVREPEPEATMGMTRRVDDKARAVGTILLEVREWVLLDF